MMAICRRTIPDYFVSLIYEPPSPIPIDRVSPPPPHVGQILISIGGKIDFNRWHDSMGAYTVAHSARYKSLRHGTKKFSKEIEFLIGCLTLIDYTINSPLSYAYFS